VLRARADGREGVGRAGGFAEPDGLSPGPVRAAAVLLAGAVEAVLLAGAVEAVLLGRPVRAAEADAVGELLWVAGAVAGLNVATDSMAPATRQTARMLASSGITVPCPRSGPASRRNRLRRRLARISLR
jgi:hypothetical protein